MSNTLKDSIDYSQSFPQYFPEIDLNLNIPLDPGIPHISAEEPRRQADIQEMFDTTLQFRQMLDEVPDEKSKYELWLRTVVPKLGKRATSLKDAVFSNYN